MGAALRDRLIARAAEEYAQLEEKAAELAVAADDLTQAMRNQEEMIAEISHWRAVDARQKAELASLTEAHTRVRSEIDQLQALLTRRSVRAALKVAALAKSVRR
jgi:hypothetical protein